MDNKRHRHKIKRQINESVLTVATYIIAVAFVFPVLWVFLMSLKIGGRFCDPPKWIFRQ